ncbi:uncharacterized protein LOC141526972 [Cotesia typhae]|uniref:uncharacterized protein LOC141526972 n=1 Tax=Cotesia typhae TaxID=2053667 RepID=UPI003D692BE8
MRILGIGYEGLCKFCGLMDMPSFLDKSTHTILLKQILNCSKTVAETFMMKAVNEEKQAMTTTENEDINHLTVSGDGTWQQRGYTSSFGVSSIIGYFTGKILDINIKNAYCKLWSSGKMEVDAMVEMFSYSETKYGVKYANYIGDGDSKTYSGIIKSDPYKNTTVNKKECIGHVQKRMGSRLRTLKSNQKGLGGRGKLTGKVIDKLTVYYGLAIRRHCDSIENMKSAIMATFYHYGSSDEKPNHDMCPKGEESWCSYQHAEARGELDTYSHDYSPLPSDVLKAIKPIYEDLSNENLLSRCIGGFNQNNNERFNQLVWKICPKTVNTSYTIVQIAAYVAMCIFNEGINSLLVLMNTLGLNCGPNSHRYAERMDAARMKVADKRANDNTREGRLQRRHQQIDILEAAMTGEELLYGPGIDDSV